MLTFKFLSAISFQNQTSRLFNRCVVLADLERSVESGQKLENVGKLIADV